MTVKIVIMSYKELTALIQRLRYPAPEGVEIEIVDALLDDALAIAKAMDEKGEVDVFVSAGANLSVLSGCLKTPLVGITVTGFDLLLALSKASHTAPIGLITFLHKLLYVDQILDTLSVKLRQITYDQIGATDNVMEELLSEGITQVIGGSLAIEKARQKGMQGIFLYSEDGVIRALDTAIKISFAKKAEAEKAQELQTIINFAHEGIIATDKQGMITVFNPSAEKITGISGGAVLGKSASDVIPSTRLQYILSTGEPELSQIQAIGEAKILTNRIPIVTKGEITGAVATFQDISVIQRAEEKIRERLYARGFVAKNTFDDIIHHSEIMTEIKQEAILYSRSDSTILILGESGTGKELFAQAIHNQSVRRKHPFIAINCAALPTTLLESELYGYEEGAFTGAKKGGKAGLFEMAHGGTIFLDEIGEISMAMQSRLLRVLQEHEVLRIGGERIMPVDIRVIAATNKNLWEMVTQGQFREDLYYRLCVLELYIPPLRQRQEDIPLFVAKFLQEYRHDLPTVVVSEIAKNPMFLEYQWPGNIRELRNIVERFAVLYQVPAEIDKGLRLVLKARNNVEASACAEKEKILQALKEVNGNKTKAAKNMGISRTTLWRKLQE